MCNLINKLVNAELLTFGGNVSNQPINKNTFEKKNNYIVEIDTTQWNSFKDIILTPAKGREENTIDDFIDPIFKILGFSKSNRLRNTGVSEQRPDLIYFDTSANCINASQDNTLLEGIQVIVEAKKFNEDLDKHQKQLRDYLDRYYAKSENAIKWGILTNGYEWRLYRYGLTGFLGFNLQNAFDDSNLFADESDRKKLVHLFVTYFGKTAFDNSADFLNGIEKDAKQAQEKVREELHKQAYPALITIYNGFLRALKRKGNLSEHDKVTAREDSIYFIYRLIFLLYSKGKELSFFEKMPNIFDQISDAPVNIEDNMIEFCSYKDGFSMEATSRFESNLHDMFRWMNDGNPELDIPQYNGGLFKKREIDKVRLDDYTIAVAIKLLLISPNGETLDYASLDVQHLGNIYERLLLFDVPVEANVYDFCYQGKVGNGKTIKLKFPDEWTCFDVDESQRKNTGTFYTPDYIVQYIVKNTIGEKLSQFASKSEDGTVITHTDNPLRDILKLKILDPAMGSGHFLIRAIDFIANFIAEHIGTVTQDQSSKNIYCDLGDITEILRELFGELDNFENDIAPKINKNRVMFWSRVIAKKCIFGVDINHFAVELAKLAIWLHTFNEKEPLQFLDHHLKCGNSLVGYFDLGNIIHQDAESFNEFVKAVQFMTLVGENRDASMLQVKESESLYKKAYEQLKPFLLRADIALASREFIKTKRKPADHEILCNRLEQIAFELGKPVKEKKIEQEPEENNSPSLFEEVIVVEKKPDEPTIEDKELIDEAYNIAQKKQFFHWKLEFPEVWFNSHNPSKPEIENGGFDIVIGNPPWGAKLDDETKNYVKNNYNTSYGKLNTYRLFTEKIELLIKETDIWGLIVPSTYLSDNDSLLIRKLLLFENSIEYIIVFPEKAKVFKDITQSVSIIICKLEKSTENEISIIDPAFYPDFLNCKYNIHKQSTFQTTPKYKILTSIPPDNLYLLSKLFNNLPLKYIANIHQGEVNVSNESTNIYFEKQSNYKPMLRGSDIDRYNFQTYFEHPKGNWLDVTKEFRNHQSIRIATQEVSNQQTNRRLNATSIPHDFFLGHTTNYLLPYPNASLYYIISILNSKLLDFLFQSFNSTNHIPVGELEQLPIPRISFVTPQHERENGLSVLKSAYARNALIPSEIKAGTDSYINTLLICNFEPDPELVVKHNSDELNEDYQIADKVCWNRTDILHDFLAYLAEEMTTYARRKYMLEQYDKKKIEAGSIDEGEVIDIANEHNLALNVRNARTLKELYTNKFDDTDKLIDSIVYRLYSLTPEEIEVVEEYFK